MDLPNRSELESRLATRIDRAFASVRSAALNGRRPDPVALENQVRAALEDQAAAVYAVMFLLFLDDDRTALIEPSVYNRLETFAANRGMEIGQARGANLAASLSSDLRDAIERGDSSFEILRQFDRARAETIGVTETTDLASQGYIEAADSIEELTGEITELWWVTARDDRVCPICGPLHQTKRDRWSLKFPSGPPAHPNCRCTLDVERIA